VCCSEFFFNKDLFTPFQLTELSVKEFNYLLVSSPHLNVGLILSNNFNQVNRIFKKFLK